jgi:four helix bundle protein
MALLHYRELVAWQKGVALVTDVYRLTAGFPKQEIYGLTSQIRRAAASIPANIAEGQGRMSRGEFRQFLGHARGSVFELETHLVIARNLGFASEEETTQLMAEVHRMGRLLNELLKSLDNTRVA